MSIYATIATLSYDMFYATGLIATFGNIFVIGLQVTWLKNAEDPVNEVGKMNRILVLNLAIGDLLVGVRYVVSYGFRISVVLITYRPTEWHDSRKFIPSDQIYSALTHVNYPVLFL